MEVLGDALADLGGRLWQEVRFRVGDVADWLVETITPPDQVVLTDRDGKKYSGLLLLERGRVVAMIAVETSKPAQRAAQVTGYHRYGPTTDIDPESPLWDRDGDPFRR